MARTINANLQAQLDTETRNPIITLTSQASSADIPFVGSLLGIPTDGNGVELTERWPYAMAHSAGPYVAVYSRQMDTTDTYTHLFLKISSDNRVTWASPIQLTFNAAFGTVHYEYASCCELTTNGNIGIVVSERIGGVRKLRYMVVNRLTGAVVTPLADLDATGAYYESTVARFGSDGSYMIFAAWKSSTTWYIRKFTHVAGTSWSTWSAASTLVVNGQADSTQERRRPFLYEVHLSTGSPPYQQWLFFDRADDTVSTDRMRNVYEVHSSNYFSSMSAAVARTSFSNLWTSAEHPSMAQVSTGSTAFMAYVKRSTSVFIDAVPSTIPSATGTHQFARDHFGAVDALKIYYDDGLDYVIVVGEDSMTGVHVFRASDFTLVKRYVASGITGATDPAFRASFAYQKIRASYLRDHKLAILWQDGGVTYPIIEVLDLLADSIKSIYPWGATDATVNAVPGSLRLVKTSNPSPFDYPSVLTSSIYIEGTTLYLVEGDPNNYMWSFSIGQSSSEVNADTVVTYLGSVRPSIYVTSTRPNVGNPSSFDFGQYSYHWDQSGQFLYVAFYTTKTGTIASNQEGFIAKIKYEDCSLINTWSKNAAGGVGAVNKVVTGFPEQGALAIAVENDLIVFSAYHNGESIPGADYDGVIVLDQSTHTIVAHTNASPINSDPARQPIMSISAMGNGNFFVSTPRSATEDFGALCIYNPNTNLLEIHDQKVNPGWPTEGSNVPVGVGWAVWDPTRNRVYQALAGIINGSGSNGGLLIYDLDGDILEPFYESITGMSISPNTPSFSVPLELVKGTEDEDVCLIKNGLGNGLAAFWARRATGTRYDLYFAEELGLFDLLPYVDEEQEIEWSQSLERDPNSLSFSLVPGGLFDPTNLSSLHRDKVERGRKIILRKGEVILSPPSSPMENAITVFVDSGSNSYQKGEVSSRRIQCYDMTKPLYAYHIPLTPPYGYGPDDFDATSYPSKPDGSSGIINHLAVVLGRMPQTSVSIPIFSNSESIKAQLSDMSLMEAIETVAARFQRVPFVDASGTLTTKEISKGIPVTDQFTSNKLAVEINPEASEADDTNRVTVKGTQSSFQQIQYSEQSMIEPAGIVGWVYKEKDVPYFPYSADYSVTATNPRLMVLEWDAKSPYPKLETVTPTSAIVRQAGGAAPVSGLTAAELATFYNEHGIQIRFGVYKEWANIVATVFKIAAGLLILASILGGIGSIPIIGGPATATAIRILAIAIGLIQLAVIALSKLWYYQVRIYAQPLGRVRQDMQATWNDFRKQQRMNGIIVERIESFPLADKVAVCQAMADWYGLRIQFSETPVNIRMLGHLKQEPGDMIQWKHPVSGQLAKSLVHSIRYRLKRGENGYDIQEMKVLGVPE